MTSRVYSASLLTLVVAGILAGAVKVYSQTPSLKSARPPVVAGRVLIKVEEGQFRAGVSAGLFGEAVRTIGVRRIAPWLNPSLVEYRVPSENSILMGSVHPALALRRIMVVEYESGADPFAVAAALSRQPGVEYAEPIYRRRLLGDTDDPGDREQWYLDVIGARAAWDSVTCDSSMVIAVVDAGINAAHEDLSAAMWRNAGELGDDGLGGMKQTNNRDDDGNGLIDDWRGYDFAGIDGVTPDNDPDPGAGSQHGTAMAGIAAASGNNGIGTVGIAYGARLMSVKITDESEAADLYNMYEGLLYAAKMGAKVINCSWGDPGRMRAEQELIDVVTGTYDAIVVAAAGNNGTDELFYPASYRGVLSVAAVRNGDTRASFSNYNYRVDLSSPGAFIYAPSGTGYRYDSGTSQACAVASGGAALIRMRYPQLRSAQAAELLRASTTDISQNLGEFASRMGTGRLNLYNAIAEGAALASARVVELAAYQIGGDRVLDPGETGMLALTVVNPLAGAPNVTLTLTVETPDVSIVPATIELGPMSAGESRDLTEDAPQISIPPGLPNDTRIIIRASVSTEHRTNDSYFEIQVGPSYLTTELNDITATFNSVGNIGHNGTNTDEGDGFRFKGAQDLLFHGGLMIALDDTRIASSVRGGPMSLGTDSGFTLQRPYRLQTDPDSSLQIGSAAFGDGGLELARRVGVEVELRSYERTAPESRNLLLVLYRIRNTSGADLTNAYAGLYLDWDMMYDGQGDIGAYDDTGGFASVRNNSIAEMTIGAALVSDQPVNFDVFDNYDIGLPSSFTSTEKFARLSGGIRTRTLAESELGMVIGGGPFTLAPNATTDLAFVLTVAEDMDALRSAIAAGREMYRTTGARPEEAHEGTLATSVSPNPASDDLLVEFWLDAPSSAVVRIVDAHGREVSRTAMAHLQPGHQSVPLKISSLSQGVYFFEITAGKRVERGKFVKV